VGFLEMKGRLNHIGLVVRGISEFAKVLQVLGLEQVTQPEPDPIQKVTACFFATGNKEDVHIEVLEPMDGTSPIANFLAKKGGGLHHLCFEVDDIDSVARDLENQGYKLVSSPVECIGYDRSFGLGRNASTRIAFFMTSNKLLIELLHRGR
jgi:methylmalonyl-CoA/ethylmalonyl-CoA epimerase